jgi:hypothetical protein
MLESLPMKKVAFATLLVVACAPHKPAPPTDSGTPQDAAKEATACVPDFQPCTSATICCVGSSVCNPGTLVCEKACMGIGSLCSANSDCCSGICNGTCE